MKISPKVLLVGLVVAFGMALPQPVRASETQKFGAVTNLPLPRFVSIKAAEANARRGPSKAHRIDWIFKRRHLPVEITAEYGHWRRIRDQDGAGGWIHYALLSGARYVVIVDESAPLRRAPNAGAEPVAIAEQGVIARLGACLPAWCELRVDGHRGWVDKTRIWGIAPGELRD